MNFADYILSFYALIIILLGFYNLKKRNNGNKLLTAISGFHLTFIIFFGFGFLAYANYDIQKDAFRRIEILQQLGKLIPYLLMGYLIVTFMEYRKFNDPKKQIIKFRITDFNSNIFCAGFLILAYIGLIFSRFSFANSSLGTFFPVFNNFVYPITILIVAKVEKKNPFSILLLILLFLLIGGEAILSSWRSQLIIFAISILIGLNIRGKINYYLLTIIAVSYFFFILPFQQLKKLNYIEFDFNPIEVFKSTLDYSTEKRFEIVVDFLAERINYTREMSYVQMALDNASLESRDGETYVEIFYQIIPRILWKDKPSYNRFTGYEIPRKIQLLQWEDQYTSWGVNSFAEFIYNFSYKYLPLFTIILYLILSFFDDISSKLELTPEFEWFLHATLFFLSLNLVSVIFSSTYFLWTFIVIIILNKIFKNKSEVTYLR